jgi:hypothetical protein
MGEDSRAESEEALFVAVRERRTRLERPLDDERRGAWIRGTDGPWVFIM